MTANQAANENQALATIASAPWSEQLANQHTTLHFTAPYSEALEAAIKSYGFIESDATISSQTQAPEASNTANSFVIQTPSGEKDAEATINISSKAKAALDVITGWNIASDIPYSEKNKHAAQLLKSTTWKALGDGFTPKQSNDRIPGDILNALDQLSYEHGQHESRHASFVASGSSALESGSTTTKALVVTRDTFEKMQHDLGELNTHTALDPASIAQRHSARIR